MHVNHQDQLAIVIPAYKATFFKETLESIARQTDNRFTVYVGDDHSPENLHPIIEAYKDKIDIVYHRFDKNMGGTDLVGQWNRCIDLAREEPWIWLFSDDDLMDEKCVEAFYQTIETNKDEDLFHFDVKIINENSVVTGKFQPFPQRLSSDEFFASRIQYALSSYVVEYIFSRYIYLKEGRFQNFDLAWGSDDATWMKFGKRKGIYTIKGPFVQWRYSQINISSNVGDRKTIIRKLASNEAYILWVRQFFEQNNLPDRTSNFDKLKWMLQQFIETNALSYQDKLQIVDQMVTRLGYDAIRLKAKLYVTYMEVKKRVK